MTYPFNPMLQRNKLAVISDIIRFSNCATAKFKGLIYKVQNGEVLPSDLTRMDKELEEVRGIVDRLQLALHKTVAP